LLELAGAVVWVVRVVVVVGVKVVERPGQV
jgi:hypothetical protein